MWKIKIYSDHFSCFVLFVRNIWKKNTMNGSSEVLDVFRLFEKFSENAFLIVRATFLMETSWPPTASWCHTVSNNIRVWQWENFLRVQCELLRHAVKFSAKGISTLKKDGELSPMSSRWCAVCFTYCWIWRVVISCARWPRPANLYSRTRLWSFSFASIVHSLVHLVLIFSKRISLSLSVRLRARGPRVACLIAARWSGNLPSLRTDSRGLGTLHWRSVATPVRGEILCDELLSWHGKLDRIVETVRAVPLSSGRRRNGVGARQCQRCQMNQREMNTVRVFYSSRRKRLKIVLNRHKTRTSPFGFNSSPPLPATAKVISYLEKTIVVATLHSTSTWPLRVREIFLYFFSTKKCERKK